MEYKFNDIEEKIKQYWKEKDIYRVTDADSGKPKYYVLDMFPYPSGAGLHVGHPLGYIASDIYARYKRMKGFNVLHPMGYDSFGLPAEQYAIQTGQHPAITTQQNIATFRRQMDQLGFSFDWSREVRTSDPGFYKWTQWIFIQLFHSWYNNATDKAEPIETLVAELEKTGNKNIKAATAQQEVFTAEEWSKFSQKQKSDVLLNYRIAYIADSWVNWCPALGTVLANDEVKDGVSERGGYPVERKLMKQWSMRITAYAERLLKGLDGLDWSDSIKETQRNWIGKSEGCSVRFQIEAEKNSPLPGRGAGGEATSIEVFTTRPDTIYGVTFLTLAPEHELINSITTPEYKAQVDAYVTYAKNRSERERMTDVKKVTGQFTGTYATHPFTGQPIPVWIGEYVLAGYGTGAVMGVPGHDSRDYGFAKHFNLDIKEVIKGGDVTKEAFEEEGINVNSSFLDGLKTPEAKKKIIDEIEKAGIGKRKINYKLRDAIFGRQRYWGEPIPIYYDEQGIPYTVDEEDLPLKLPEVDKYLPTEDGEPPLARASSWNYSPANTPLLWRGEGGEDKSAPATPLRGAEVKEASANTPLLRRGEGGEDKTAEDVTLGYLTGNSVLAAKLLEFAKENRKEPTPAEDLLWQKIRNNKLDDKFRRQHPIGNFVVDFVSLPKRLIIELDGEGHKENTDYDKERTKLLEELGFKVLRFWNDEVIKDIDNVLSKITAELSARPILTPNPSPKERGMASAGFGEGGAFPLELTTMPGWAGSSWYFLRYEDPHNSNALASKEKINYWQNIDFYIGGAEHSTGHLIYFRFWTKFLHDLGIVPFEEPAKRLVNQGMIQGRSSFAYRLMPLFDWGTNNKEETAIIPLILLSKSIYEQIKTNTLEKYNHEKIYSGSIEIFKRINPHVKEVRLEKKIQAYPIHVDVSIVEDDILDIDKFRKWLPENSDAEFFFEEDGKYLCGTEVEKMSKSKYNVVNPDDIVSKYGADCFRMYEMFLGPLELSKPWDTKGIDGVSRFLRKLWKLFYDDNGSWVVTNEVATNEELKVLHKTIKKAEEDMERLSFNTSVSAFMICVNTLTDLKCHKAEVLKDLLLIMAPLAPFTTEFLWQELAKASPWEKQEGSVMNAAFPKVRAELLVENTFEYPIAINGKTRAKIELPLDALQESIEKEVLALEAVQKHLEGKTPKKVIVVKGRMVNVVV